MYNEVEWLGTTSPRGKGTVKLRVLSTENKMKKNRITFFVALLVVLIACGKKNDTKVANQPPALSTTVNTATFEPLTPELAKARQEWITRLKRELVGVGDAEWQPRWQPINKGDSFTPLCELQGKFNTIAAAVATFDNLPSLHITWADLGMTEDAAKKREREVGEQYARELVRLIKMPLIEREKMGQCYTPKAVYTSEHDEYETSIAPASYKLSDTRLLALSLDRVLFIINEKKEDFGLSHDEFLRALR